MIILKDVRLNPMILKLSNILKVIFLYTNIVKRVVRLFFDVLHGIKRMDVPLIMVVEFMVFLAYDGKLETDSDVEKDLFSSAINQFKDRSNIF